MTDLTKIEKPFFLLTDEEKAALKAWPHGWELMTDYGWTRLHHPVWAGPLTYRAIPAPLTKPSVNWDHVANWVVCMVKTQTGNYCGFEQLPRLNADHWGVNEGWKIDMAVFASLIPGTCDWRDSLVVRPGYEW